MSLDALIPPDQQSGHLVNDLVEACREAWERRRRNSKYGGDVIAALHRELRSWREFEHLTGIPHSSARRWANPPPTVDETPDQPED